MGNVIVRQIAPAATWSHRGQAHPALVEACIATFNDEPAREIPWAPPTKEEWRRATLVIAKQIAVHIAGYRDHEEFARDGGMFAWDILDTVQHYRQREVSMGA